MHTSVTPYFLEDKVSGKKEKEECREATLKHLIIQTALSPPPARALYLLTISPSLFGSPWLIAPLICIECEMGGAGCTLLWRLRAHLISAAPLHGKLIKEKVEISAVRHFVFREIRRRGLKRDADD